MASYEDAPLDDKLCPAKEYLQRLKQESIGRRPWQKSSQWITDAGLGCKRKYHCEERCNNCARTTNCQILEEEVDFGEKLLDDDSSQTHRRPELEGDYLDVVEQYKDYILGTDCMPRTLLQRFIWTLLQRPGHFYSALGIVVSEKEQWLWQVCCNSHMYLNLAFWQFSHYGICLARNLKYLAIFLKAALTAATNSEDAASSHCQHKLPLMFTRKHSMAAMFQGNTHSMET